MTRRQLSRDWRPAYATPNGDATQAIQSISAAPRRGGTDAVGRHALIQGTVSNPSGTNSRHPGRKGTPSTGPASRGWGDRPANGPARRGGTQRHLRGECQPVCSIDMAGLAAACTRSGAATGHREGNGEARSRGRGRRRRRERIPGRRQGRKGSTQPGLRPLLRNVPREPAALGAAAHRAIAQSTADRVLHMLPRGGVSKSLLYYPTCSVLSHTTISYHHAISDRSPADYRHTWKTSRSRRSA